MLGHKDNKLVLILTRQTTTDAAGNVIADYRYTLHSTGRREQIEELHSGRVSTYTYDALYRLTHDAISDPVNGDYNAEYRFDKVGNRIYSIIDGVHTAYSYDDNDRLTQQGGVTYAYDANGNTLTETEDGLVSARYTYSAKNKLLAVTKAGETTNFAYNPDGIRTRKAGSGATTDFIVDQNRDYAQVLQEVVNGAKQVSYVYGDDLLSQARAGDVSYYVYDGQGSVRSLTNQTGVQTDSYHYDAFGILLHSEGNTPNSYLYTGEQYDASLDQYYLRARYYDQNQGRFTQMDTYLGRVGEPVTLHKYLYVHADPVNGTDPSGYLNMFGLAITPGNIGVLASSSVGRVIIWNAFKAGAKKALTSKQFGLLTLVGMAGAGSKIAVMVSSKDDEEDKGRKIKLYHGASSNRAQKIVTTGFRLGGDVFLAEEFADARFFATQCPPAYPHTVREGHKCRIKQDPAKKFTVITFEIPERIAQALGIDKGQDIGVEREMSYVQMGLRGQERILRSNRVPLFNGCMFVRKITTTRTRI
ncbi:RHS repeat domain-containing protein [Hahella sp. NBU794]|uniref:RHS repeat domain-containing protein n=1 Tax=Hahella sp. NBU794 TaxID=3422590 RepID=UPI003D6E5FA4